MIRKLLEDQGVNLTDIEFKEVMIIVTDDIRENRIKFNKKTNIEEMFTIALRTFCLMKRVVTFDVPWAIIE